MDLSATPTAQVANAVNRARLAAKVSQTQLAIGSGIPRVTLIRRLNGHSSFTVDELARIADYLDVPVTDLVRSVA